MSMFRRHYRFNRVVLLAVALLISNIVTISCAMAVALCMDCPEHEPVLCVDSCTTAEAVINDQSSDTKANTFRPLSVSVGASPADSCFDPGRSSVVDNSPPDPYASPPLHLQFCVFLK